MTEDRGVYHVKGRTEVRRESRLPYTDPRYVPPKPDDVRAAQKLLRMTGSEVAALLGVDGRTWRKWTGGERDIPYSAWRLLLIESGLALEDELARNAGRGGD